MLQQHLAQVDRQAATTAAASAAAGGGGKDQASSRSSRSSRTQQQRSTLSSKLLHHQSKLEQALTADNKTALSGTKQGLAAGIESGGGAALMSNFAALATGNRQLTAAASLRADSSGEHSVLYI